jgi:hypothetical protein
MFKALQKGYEHKFVDSINPSSHIELAANAIVPPSQPSPQAPIGKALARPEQRSIDPKKPYFPVCPGPKPSARGSS